MLKKSKIKLVVSDLDGTLLHSNGKLDSEILSTIKNGGFLFTIASGRNKVLIKEYIDCLDIQIPFIANNGAEIVLQDRVLYQNNILKEDLIYILDLAREMHVEFLVNCDNCILTSNSVVYMKPFVDRFNNILPVCNNMDLYKIEHYQVQKIMFYHSENYILSNFARLINDNCACTVCARAEGQFYCAKHKDADKGIALKKLCETLNVNMKEVLVFGDNYNDLEMFKNAAYSVATDNAENLLKEKADFVTKSNNQDGVSYFLQNCIY